MKILKFLANAGVFMTDDFRFYKVRTVNLTAEGANVGLASAHNVLVQEIEPDYKNSHVEIFVIERSIFSPLYFAVKIHSGGRRELYAEVFGKKLFLYKIQMLGAEDFAVAWIGETRKLNVESGVCWEDVQTGFGENWSVFTWSSENGYEDVSQKLGAVGDVHISALKFDDGILQISLASRSGMFEEKDLRFIRDGNGYRRIEQAECEQYWKDVCNGQVPVSSWFPASPEMFCNLNEFAEVI